MNLNEDLIVDYGDFLRYIYRTQEVPFPKGEAPKSFKNVDNDSLIGVLSLEVCFNALVFANSMIAENRSICCLTLKCYQGRIRYHYQAALRSNKHDPPSQSTQSRAISRMLMLYAMIVNPLHHIFTSKAVEAFELLLVSVAHFTKHA